MIPRRSAEEVLRIRKSPFRLTADSQPTVALAPRWACLQT